MTGLRISRSRGGAVVVHSDTRAGPRLSGSGVMGPSGPPGLGAATFGWHGTLQIVTGLTPWPIPADCDLARVDVALGAVADEDCIFNVNLNGDPIFSEDERPTILAGETHGFSIPDLITEAVTGDLLTFDIIQVGDLQPGAYLTGVVLLR